MLSIQENSEILISIRLSVWNLMIREFGGDNSEKLRCFREYHVKRFPSQESPPWMRSDRAKMTMRGEDPLMETPS